MYLALYSVNRNPNEDSACRLHNLNKAKAFRVIIFEFLVIGQLNIFAVVVLTGHTCGCIVGLLDIRPGGTNTPFIGTEL